MAENCRRVPEEDKGKEPEVRYYDYSKSQLEAKAENLVRETNPARFLQPEKIDVYDVIDFLGCTPDWLYLTPVGKVLGMTAFSDFIWPAWPSSHFETGMQPHEVSVQKGTILIDQSLVDAEDKEKERFTVMHECFHWILHQKCYQRFRKEYSAICTSSMMRNTNKKPMTALEINEWQANYCAASFLMPKTAVEHVFSQALGQETVIGSYLDPCDGKVKSAIHESAEQFGVHYSPMLYRLQGLQIVKKTENY